MNTVLFADLCNVHARCFCNARALGTLCGSALFADLNSFGKALTGSHFLHPWTQSAGHNNTLCLPCVTRVVIVTSCVTQIAAELRDSMHRPRPLPFPPLLPSPSPAPSSTPSSPLPYLLSLNPTHSPPYASLCPLFISPYSLFLPPSPSPPSLSSPPPSATSPPHLLRLPSPF